MTTIVFSLNDSEDYFQDAEELTTYAFFPELKQVKENWRRLFNKYSIIRGVQSTVNSPEWIQVNYEPVPTQGAYIYQFQLDQTFFDQLVMVYAQYGWGILGYLQAVAFDKGNLPRVTEAGQDLIRDSVRLLLVKMHESLSELELSLTNYGQKKWDISIETLQAYQAQFDSQTKSVFVLKDRTLASNLFKLVKEYDELTRKIEKLQKDRAQVDKNGRYQPGKNDASYWNMYRTFGQAELKLNDERLKKASDISKLYAPAAFILDELQDFIRKADIKSFKGVSLKTSYNQTELENRIYQKLVTTIDGLKELKKEVKRPSQLSSINIKDVDSIVGLERLVAKKSIDTFEKKLGAFQTISSLAPLGPILVPIAIMEWDLIRGLDRNPVFGFQSLVEEYWQQLVDNDPRSWKRVVFQSYQNALLAELNYQIYLNKKISLIIKLVKFIEAVISVLALIASVVATEGAALPWAVSLVCTVIETTSNVMTIALLSVMVLELKLGGDENQKLWKESLLLLSFEDIETIRSVGGVLNRIQLYRISISVEVVKMLIKSKLAKMNTSLVEKYDLPDELDLIRRAIDLENLAGDLETLIVDNGLLVKPRDA